MEAWYFTNTYFYLCCPLFTKRLKEQLWSSVYFPSIIEIPAEGTINCIIYRDQVETVIHSDDAFAPVGYLNLKEAHLEDKPKVSLTSTFCLPLRLSFEICLQYGLNVFSRFLFIWKSEIWQFSGTLVLERKCVFKICKGFTEIGKSGVTWKDLRNLGPRH